MKRPLFEAAVALVLGELGAVHKEVLILCILCIFVCFLQRYLQSREAGRCLIEFMLLLAFFGLGYVQMQEQKSVHESYEKIAKHTLVKLTGKVQNIRQKSGMMQMDVRIEECVNMDTKVRLPADVLARVLLESDVEIKTGQRIEVSGGCQPLECGRNLGNFDERQYYYGEGIVVKIQGEHLRLLDASHSRLKESLAKLQEELCRNIDDVCETMEASVLKAILFGDKTTLDAEVKALYQKNGIAHILAISGVCTLFLVSLEPP